MNVQIVHEGTDITDSVISYNRDKSICNGIGTIDITVVYTVPVTIQVWDTIVLYEEGHKKATYFVSDVNEASDKGTFLIQCQDGSKKLVDNFIEDQYTIDYETGTYSWTTTRYWIELFLNAAGVSYNFTTTGSGSPLADGTSLGLASAYDLIMGLLAQSGWYMHFNQNNVVQIGDLSTSLSNPVETLNNTDIISLESRKHDTMLRNRAVVWGSGDVTTGTWVFADVSKNTPWNYDTNDKRTIVYANHTIKDFGTANYLANKLLEEFSKINYERTVRVTGGRNIDIGDVVFIKSKYGNGAGLVTTINVTLSSGGFTTDLTLDERCPKLFGYVGFDSDYVYVGTFGSGIWRKLIQGSAWEDYSTGLGDLYIRDLSIANGQFASVSFGGIAYLRDVSGVSWFPIYPGDFTDNSDSSTVSSLSVYAIACVVDQVTSEIYVLYGYTRRGWIVKFDSSGNVLETTQVKIDDEYDHRRI